MKHSFRGLKLPIELILVSAVARVMAPSDPGKLNIVVIVEARSITPGQMEP